jgi:hypothetical protein
VIRQRLTTGCAHIHPFVVINLSVTSFSPLESYRIYKQFISLCPLFGYYNNYIKYNYDDLCPKRCVLYTTPPTAEFQYFQHVSTIVCVHTFLQKKKNAWWLITICVLLFTVYCLGGRSHIRVQPGKRGEFQRRIRVLHKNGTLPQLRRGTVDLGWHTG